MAPLCNALRKRPDQFDVQICVTAQHREMLDQALDVFGICPDIDLDLMTPGQDLFDVTANTMLGMRRVLKEHQPDMLLVHGDTTTTFASSLAAFYLNVPVGHVEAGLRTHDLRAPFPEEFNRQVASKVATFHFAPTEGSKTNLVREGVDSKRILVTGNTVIDAMLWTLEAIESNAARKSALASGLDRSLGFGWADKKYILITGHRRENFGAGFENICEAIIHVVAKYPDIHFVYPVHLNPNVRGPVQSRLSNLINVHLIEPLGYEAFLLLLQHCYLVLTDSGGIQEEAPSLGKPVLVMRDVTEKPEAVHAGTVRLVGASSDKINQNISELIENRETYQKMSSAHNPYGDGFACERIVDVLSKYKSQSFVEAASSVAPLVF